MVDISIFAMKANKVGADKMIKIKSKVLQLDLKKFFNPNLLSLITSSRIKKQVIKLSIISKISLLLLVSVKPSKNIVVAFNNIKQSISLSFRNSFFIVWFFFMKYITLMYVANKSHCDLLGAIKEY